MKQTGMLKGERQREKAAENGQQLRNRLSCSMNAKKHPFLLVVWGNKKTTKLFVQVNKKTGSKTEEMACVRVDTVNLFAPFPLFRSRSLPLQSIVVGAALFLQPIQLPFLLFTSFSALVCACVCAVVSLCPPFANSFARSLWAYVRRLLWWAFGNNNKKEVLDSRLSTEHETRPYNGKAEWERSFLHVCRPISLILTFVAQDRHKACSESSSS